MRQTFCNDVSNWQSKPRVKFIRHQGVKLFIWLQTYRVNICVVEIFVLIEFARRSKHPLGHIPCTSYCSDKEDVRPQIPYFIPAVQWKRPRRRTPSSRILWVGLARLVGLIRLTKFLLRLLQTPKMIFQSRTGLVWLWEEHKVNSNDLFGSRNDFRDTTQLG